MQYKVKYVKLSHHYLELVATQRDWYLKFINGLHFELLNAMLLLKLRIFRR